jgi:hypothetical protein
MILKELEELNQVLFGLEFLYLIFVLLGNAKYLI